MLDVNRVFALYQEMKKNKKDPESPSVRRRTHIRR